MKKLHDVTRIGFEPTTSYIASADVLTSRYRIGCPKWRLCWARILYSSGFCDMYRFMTCLVLGDKQFDFKSIVIIYVFQDYQYTALKYIHKLPPISKINQRWTDTGFHEMLKLPLRNEFIATKFDILPRDEDCADSPKSASGASMPTLIKDTPFGMLWFKQDDTFLLPKVCFLAEFSR